ncbi:MAG: ferrochelatase, partial [Deltaproteobacteria bacterium]|nr:ferrochelatase [Deltaproteobacteria bacterium]
MIAVFLLDFGGPEKPADVQPFLKNLFSDRNIFPFPFAQEIFAHIVAKSRAPKVIKQYEKIGGGSPAPRQSKEVAADLERALNKANLEIRVFIGFRYWRPSIADTLAEIAKCQSQGMVVIPMFPHYSTATTLSVLQAFQQAYDTQKLAIPYQLVEWWYDHPHYIAGWCYSIQKALEKFEPAVRAKVPVLFTAHSLPKSFVVERRDPYPKQIHECAEKIMTYLGGDHPSYISYQSKVGPVEWLTPATIEFVAELPKKGF